MRLASRRRRVRALSGYGRDGRLHDQGFFELAVEQPALVGFMTDDAQARAMLELLAQEELPLFHALLPAEYGIAGRARPRCAIAVSRVRGARMP